MDDTDVKDIDAYMLKWHNVTPSGIFKRLPDSINRICIYYNYKSEARYCVYFKERSNMISIYSHTLNPDFRFKWD